MGPGKSPEGAFVQAVADIAAGGGGVLEMPAVTVAINSAFTVPSTVGLFIPVGGQLKGNAALTILGRVTSEATEPFSGSVQSGS